MYWCLLGVLVVIIGFAIKLEPIAIIVVSAIVTAIFGGINVIDLLETVGTTFVANRNQLITIILMILTGTLERNGLKEAGADLIRRAKGLTTGMLIAIWGVLDEIFIKWLPDSGYEVLPGIESYELYDRRSRIKLASMLLIFPLRKK